MDSSRAEVCSGDVPCFEGSCARCSFSTYSDAKKGHCQPACLVSHRERRAPGRGRTNSNLEIHHFLRKRRHAIVEAEAVLSNILSGEDEITLPLFRALHDDIVIGTDLRANHCVVDIEGASGLDLGRGYISFASRCSSVGCKTYGKVESELRISLVDIGEEAGFLVGRKFVRQCGARDV